MPSSSPEHEEIPTLVLGLPDRDLCPSDPIRKNGGSVKSTEARRRDHPFLGSLDGFVEYPVAATTAEGSHGGGAG